VSWIIKSIGEPDGSLYSYSHQLSSLILNKEFDRMLIRPNKDLADKQTKPAINTVYFTASAKLYGSAADVARFWSIGYEP
jgi:hypothetical protein